MSFTFGSPTTNSGSTFGTTTPSTGFSFGGGDAAKPFGSSNTENKPAFNFTSPTTSAPAFPSFSFGAKTATTTAASSLFAAPATTAQPAFGANKPSFFGGFMSPPNQTVGSPGFGNAQNAASPQNTSLGMPQPQSTPAPAFGTPTTQATAAPGAAANSGFSFGAATAGGGGGGFSFAATPASGFSAPQTATAITSTAPQTTQPSFLTSTTSSAFGSTPAFGQSSAFGAKPGSAFSFGSTAAPAFGAAATTSAPAPAFGTATPSPLGGFMQSPASAAPAPAAAQAGAGAGAGAAPLSFAAAAAPAQPTQPVSFAAPPQASAAPTFGTSQPALSFGSPASQPAKTSAPSVLSFGTPASTAATATSLPGFGAVSTPASTGLSFGASTTAAATTGLSFAASTAAPVALAAPAALAAPSALTAPGAAPGLSFGLATTTQASSTGLSFGTTTAPSLSFGTKTTAAPATSSTASTTAPSGITALGKATAATTLPSLTTATTTTAAGPPAMVSSITFAQLEENINKWTLELEEQEKTFINQATQINAWDRLLIANGEKIVELNDAVQAVKNEQQSLEHELDFVLAQQKELEELLTPLEKQLPDRHKDPEREHMYSLAENLDTQLRQMSEDLKEVIEHLNETNRSQDSNDPIVQIGRILNAHMSSMQWVDNSIAQISTKLEQLKATHDALRRDNERSFHLTYN